MRGWVFCAIIVAPYSFASDYYISSQGNDTNSGLNLENALHTVAAVNKLALIGGDRIFFEGGHIFDGGLVLTSSASSAQPIEVTSFGSGRAVLRNLGGHGIYAANAGGITIDNLIVSGSTCTSDAITEDTCDRSIGTGVLFTNNLAGNVKLDGVTLENLLVYGFKDLPDAEDPTQSSGLGGYGVLVVGLADTSGYQNVTIDHVISHHNAKTGIQVDSDYPNIGNFNVNITYSEAYENNGIPNLNQYTGSGIILAGTDDGSIMNSYAHDNGKFNDSNSGPVGIWAYNANYLTISSNKSMRNWTRGGSDGGGFDLDGGVTYSVMEYNYSEGNAGSGYLLAQYPGAPLFYSNSVSNNVSVRDGRNDDSASLLVWGDVYYSDFQNNQVVSDISPIGYCAGAMEFTDWTGTGVHIQSNTLIVYDNISFFNFVMGPYDHLHADADLLMDKNSYVNCGTTFQASYEYNYFTSIDTWRQASSGNVQFEPSGPQIYSNAVVQDYCTGYQNPPPVNNIAPRTSSYAPYRGEHPTSRHNVFNVLR